MQKKILIFILALIVVSIFSFSILAQESNITELEWRQALIDESQKLINEDEIKLNNMKNKIGSMITTYPSDGSQINPGIIYRRKIASFNFIDINFNTELFYLRQKDELLGFASLALDIIYNIYLGGGTSIIGKENSQVFIGWEPTNNIFIELKAIDSKGDFSNSKIYPALGFQINF